MYPLQLIINSFFFTFFLLIFFTFVFFFNIITLLLFMYFLLDFSHKILNTFNSFTNYFFIIFMVFSTTATSFFECDLIDSQVTQSIQNIFLLWLWFLIIFFFLRSFKWTKRHNLISCFYRNQHRDRDLLWIIGVAIVCWIRNETLYGHGDILCNIIILHDRLIRWFIDFNHLIVFEILLPQLWTYWIAYLYDLLTFATPDCSRRWAKALPVFHKLRTHRYFFMLRGKTRILLSEIAEFFRRFNLVIAGDFVFW